MSHGRPHLIRDLAYFYPTPEYTGYGEAASARRFSVLQSIPDLDDLRLLDIGSGRCNLLTWLRANGYSTHYEAVDIREEALRLCPCPPTHTHTGVPAPTGARAWDIVCLFGTVTFNIGSDRDGNRGILRQLLGESLLLHPRHIVFTTIRSEKLNTVHQLVDYDRNGIDDLVRWLDPISFEVREDLDPTEWIVHCSFVSDK